MKYFSLLIIALILTSCSDDNNVSTIPSISFETLEFKKSDNNFNQDSLILNINFIDGDGDLGLSNDENNYPYHPFNAIIDQEFNWVTLGSNSVSPPLYVYEPDGSYYLYSNEDNRPSFNCENYIIDTVNSTSKLDTFYIQKNENNKNIFVEFYKKENDDFILIDWKRIFDQEYGCGIDFDSRFPPLNVSNSSQLLTGKLRYAMVSYGFEMILKNDLFKLKVYIKDRDLNMSNIIETPEVTLEEILVN
tara:strand:- start:4305 stop:5045 length:741 start_codon:yes stop_codon:yes gene_type:complete